MHRKKYDDSIFMMSIDFKKEIKNELKMSHRVNHSTFNSRMHMATAENSRNSKMETYRKLTSVHVSPDRMLMT